jgi:hypothetical protein
MKMSKFEKVLKKATKATESFVKDKAVPFIQKSTEKLDNFIEKQVHSAKKALNEAKDEFCEKYNNKKDFNEEDTSNVEIDNNVNLASIPMNDEVKRETTLTGVDAQE